MKGGYMTETAEKDNLKKSKLWYNKGVDFTESKQYEQALMAYDQALTFDDKDPDIWNNKCYILNILAKYEEAVKAGSVAVKISPQDSQIWNNLRDAYIGCNNQEKADECKKNMKSFNFSNQSDCVNSKIRIAIGLVILLFVVLTFLKLGIIGSYAQFQERPLDTLLYGITGVWSAFFHYNFIGIVISALFGWFILGPYYADLANEYNRNPTWGFFYGVFFGIVAGFIYIPYLLIVGKKIIKNDAT